MTSEELEKLKKWIATLSSPDERAAMEDAFNAIQAARRGGGGGGGGGSSGGGNGGCLII